MLVTGLVFALQPVVNVPLAAPARRSPQHLLSWTPGEIRCDGIAVDGAAALPPSVEMAFVDPQRVKAISYRFAIDGEGRPRSIVRNSDELFTFGQDVGPALAASRFPAGAKRNNCLISYAPKLDTFASAPIADLAEYSVIGTGVKLPKEGWDRFAALGNCRDAPRPAPLLRAHPEFLKLKASTGARDWSLVAYDTDADGRPINLRIAHGTNNVELDAAALDAIRASRFTGGARTGCLYPYWRSAAKLSAPPVPAEATLRPANAMCPAKVNWATRPTTIYPPAYRKRAIEGWAIVAFDTAPWGEVGNVRVLEAQPSSDFGQQASFIVRSGRVAASARGASGCVETVKFLIPGENASPEDGDEVAD